ncbi:hypothetical protein [Streptomyces sp. NPDC004135]
MTTPVPLEPAPADSLPSPLEAVTDLRAAARWIIAAAGAVGALLLGGGPLVALGKVDDLTGAILVGVGLVISLAGVGWAIWSTSEVLIPPITTFEDLDAPGLQPLRDLIARSPEDFFGPMSRDLAGLRRHRQIAANFHAALGRETDPRRRAALESALARARRNIERAGVYERRLLALIHVWQIRAALRRARVQTMIAAVVVAFGAVVFLTAAGSSDVSDGKTKPPSSVTSCVSANSVRFRV